MIECPRCGLYMSGLESECDICGYQPVWEDYYDNDLIDINSVDEILKYNSFEVLDIVRERIKIKPNINGNICFCPQCNSYILQSDYIIRCNNCGYQGFLEMDPELLWKEIVEVMIDAPFKFIEKYNLDNFWFAHGHEHYKGQGAKALLCYNKAIELNEFNGDAWCGKAAIYDEFGDTLHRNECYKHMLKSYNRQLKLNPEDDYTWNKKGEYLLKINHLKNALKCFNNAIKYDPNNYEYWNNKGDYYNRVNDYDSALKCYDKALNINNHLQNTLLSKALIYKELKKYPLMLDCYDKLIEFSDSPSFIWKRKFDYYCMIKDFEKARYSLDKAIESDEYLECYLDEYLEDEADMYYNMGEYTQALIYYDKAISINEENDNAWFQKALIYDKLEKYDLMISCYEKVLKINPEDDAAWFNIGLYHENNGRYMKAIKYYDKSLKLLPNDEDAWSNKGYCYFMRYHKESAKLCFKEVLKINPKNKYAKKMLKELK